MKSLKLFVPTLLMTLSMNAMAMNLSVNVDPSLLTQGNFVQLGYRVYQCSNKPVCPITENGKSEMAMTIPADKWDMFKSVLTDAFASFELPARSTVDSADSYFSIDIMKNGVKSNLPGCQKVINGMNALTVNVTPAGCSIS